MRLNKEVEFADEKASSIAGEALASIRMIIASGAERRVSKRYAGWIEESRKRGRKLDLVQGVMFSPGKSYLPPPWFLKLTFIFLVFFAAYGYESNIHQGSIH